MNEQKTITYEEKVKFVQRKTPIMDFHQRIAALPVLLRHGFGVEDIALRFDCTPELIRYQVAQMRASGQLDDMFKPKTTFRSIGELAAKLTEGQGE